MPGAQGRARSRERTHGPVSARLEVGRHGEEDLRGGERVPLGRVRAMRGQTFQALGIPPFRIGKTVPTEALKAMLALQSEIERLRDERAATPEEARRANVALRRLMRTQNNYIPEIEDVNKDWKTKYERERMK